MASYRGHLMLAAPLGVAYGSIPLLQSEPDWWGPAVLGAGLCTIGGLMPDLDSDSGVPVRELFGVMAAVVPALMFRALSNQGLPLEQVFAILAGVYVLIRYGVSTFFKHCTVHRGMFHSIPAMLIAGLLLYLFYPSRDGDLRLYLGGAVMLGFVSHLVLDELCSVDFMGMRLRLNKFAGSALKFASPSWSATLTCYAILGALLFYGWSGGMSWAHWPDGVQKPAWLQAHNGPRTP